MIKKILPAIIGITLALAGMFLIDTVREVWRAAAIAELQMQPAADWMAIEDMRVGVDEHGRPSIRFVGTPSRDLFARVTISTRNIIDGTVLCSGGSRMQRYDAGMPVAVDSTLAKISGLNQCAFPAGQYSVRLTFVILDEETQIEKTLVYDSAPFVVPESSGMLRSAPDEATFAWASFLIN